MRIGIIAGWIFLLAVPSIAQTASTLRVPVPYPTIQSAVLATKPRDVILVAPGIYRETVDATKTTAYWIRIVSEAGPHRTVIDGGGKGPAVTLLGGDLEGFTVTGGASATDGGGVRCLAGFFSAGCRVIGCVVAGNRALRDGGGIHGPASVEQCVVHGNHAGGSGGGLHLSGRYRHLVSTAVHHNTAAVDGGGATLSGLNPTWMTECTWFGNSCSGAGGALRLESGTQMDIVNSILWGNRAKTAGPELSLAGGSRAGLRHSVLQGGAAGIAADATSRATLGTRVITADPLLVDEAGGDYHLRARSPCYQAGDGAYSRPRVSFTDVDGDPRVYHGALDIGADEFHPHFYVSGAIRPGADIAVRAIGPPGVSVVWGASLVPDPLTSPVIIPGSGALLIEAPIWFVALGRADLDGVAELRLKIPPGVPVGTTFPSQALIGYRLSNLFTIVVR